MAALPRGTVTLLFTDIEDRRVLCREVLRVVNPANLQLAQSLMSPLAPTLRP